MIAKAVLDCMLVRAKNLGEFFIAQYTAPVLGMSVMSPFCKPSLMAADVASALRSAGVREDMVVVVLVAEESGVFQCSYCRHDGVFVK